MIPFQGGTNEEVVHRMYRALNSEGNAAEKHLEVFWCTSTDETQTLERGYKETELPRCVSPLELPQGTGLDNGGMDSLSQSSSCQ